MSTSDPAAKANTGAAHTGNSTAQDMPPSPSRRPLLPQAIPEHAAVTASHDGAQRLAQLDAAPALGARAAQPQRAGSPRFEGEEHHLDADRPPAGTLLKRAPACCSMDLPEARENAVSSSGHKRSGDVQAHLPHTLIHPP